MPNDAAVLKNHTNNTFKSVFWRRFLHKSVTLHCSDDFVNRSGKRQYLEKLNKK